MPLPLPEEPLVIVSQDEFVAAVQPQPPGAITETLPVPPMFKKELLVVDNVNEQALETAIDKVADPLPWMFVALMVTLLVPAAEGTPAITPDAELNAKPAGSVDVPKLVGPLVAVIW